MALQDKLITKEDVKLYKQLSFTLNQDTFDAQVIDAQIQDVAPLLGEKLFNAILKNPATYASLLDQGGYTVSGETFTNYGLKAVIAFYTYARYRMFGSVTETPFGFIEKLEGNESRPESDFSKKTQYTLNRDSAFTIWKSVENFLIRTDEPLFRSGTCLNNTGRSGGIILSKISKH